MANEKVELRWDDGRVTFTEVSPLAKRVIVPEFHCASWHCSFMATHEFELSGRSNAGLRSFRQTVRGTLIEVPPPVACSE